MADPGMIFRGPVSERDRVRGERMAIEAEKRKHLRRRLWGEGYAQTRVDRDVLDWNLTKIATVDEIHCQIAINQFCPIRRWRR